MAQYSTSLRVFSLIALASFFIVTYLVASRSHLSVPSIAHFRTSTVEQWDHGLSLPKTSLNSQPAGEALSDLEQLVNKLVEAKIATWAANELKKRQTPGGTQTPDPLSIVGPNPSPSSGGIAGLLGGLTGGGDGIAGALSGSSGALGMGIAEGTIDGLKLPKKQGVTPPAQSGTNAVAFNLGEGLSSTFTSEVNTTALMTGMVDVAAVARGFAGGLANGTAMGAKLTQQNVAPNPNDTTPEGVASNFAFTLQNTLLSYVDTNALAASLNNPAQTQMLMAQLAQSIVPAANGIGQGTAQGLKLTAPGAPPTAMMVDPNNVQAPALAHDFSFALTSSFLESVDPAILTPPKMTPEQTAAIQQMVLAALPGVGTGIGSGTAIGLGLAKPSVKASNDTPATVNAAAEDTSRALTQSFFSSLDVSKLIALSMPAPGAPMTSTTSMMNNMLGPAAEGLGKGLGAGTAIGLGLKTDMPMSPVNSTDTSAVTEAFSRNLVVNFLNNGTAQKLGALAGPLLAAAPMPKIEVSKVAEGFGRGLVDGVESGLGMTSVPADTFDDTAQGASVGFGKGLGESGAGLVMGLISGKPDMFGGLGGLLGGNASSPAQAPASAPGSAPAQAPATVGAPAGDMVAAGGMDATTAMPAGEAGAMTPTRRTDIARRDSAPAKPDLGALPLPPAFSNLNITELTSQLIANLNVTQVNEQNQKFVQAVGCIGFGGLFAIGQGLQNSKTINGNAFLNRKVPGLGNTTFTLRSDGNRFDIQPGLAETRTNGILLKRLTNLLFIHIVAMITAYFVLFPIVLLLRSSVDITCMIGRPQLSQGSPRKQFLIQLIGFLPLVIIGVAVGAVASGDAPHFNTPHKGFGYFLSLFGIIWIFTNRASNATPTGKPSPIKRGNTILVIFMLLFSIVVLITGWNDLSTISLCLTSIVTIDAYVGVGLFTSGLLVSAIAVMALVFFMGRWIGTAPQITDMKTSRTPVPVTAREAKHISGPFLVEEDVFEKKLTLN